MIEQKECARCSRLFPRNSRLSQLQWDKAVYCSLQCSAKAIHSRPPLSTIFAKVTIDQITKCWIWQGAKDTKGYGLTSHNGNKNLKLHRLIYELAVGPIPDDLLVLHRCDVRSCCNPFHLFLGTHKDNSDDKILKGRANWLSGEANANARLTAEQVIAIRADNRSQIDIAADYGVAQTTISAIKRKLNWKVIGSTPVSFDDADAGHFNKEHTRRR